MKFNRHLEVIADFGTRYTAAKVIGRDDNLFDQATAIALSGVNYTEDKLPRLNDQTNVEAFGDEAAKMIGKTSSDIQIFQPMRTGVVEDREIMKRYIEKMLGVLIGTKKSWLSLTGSNPRRTDIDFIISVPPAAFDHNRTKATELAGLVHEVASNAELFKAGEVRVGYVDQGVAAAIGSGLPVDLPAGHMVIEMGGGTTNLTVVTLGNSKKSVSIPIGGNYFNEELIDWVRRNKKMNIGPAQAEAAKIACGLVYKNGFEPRSYSLSGQSIREDLRGPVKNVTLTDDEALQAFTPTIDKLVEKVNDFLENIPYDLCNSVLDKGSIICGGTGRMLGWSYLFEERCRLTTVLPESVEVDMCGFAGLEEISQNPEKHRRVVHYD